MLMDDMKKDKKRFFLLWIMFLILSCLYISPREPTLSSPSPTKQLKRRTTANENSERIDYIDDDGNITIAENLGYATVIIKTDGQEERESFYDEHGDPAVLRLGYSAIMREYDKNGNMIRITYLGADGKPVTTRNGYASEVREYNQQSQLTGVRYYNAAEEPACSANSGYGRDIQYDENGNQGKVTYIDSSDEPMMTPRGYAIISRTYYLTDGPEYGQVESEFYFGARGEPVRLQLDQYGLHNEYDEYGRATTVTFLDAAGNPMVNNRGYATVRRAYSDKNQIIAERYFDESGNPCQLSEGQYGYRWKDGKRVYLDENGNDQLSLKNILYTHSWLVIIIATAVLILSVIADKKLNIIMLIICILTILYLTLMNRNSISTQSGIGLFTSFQRILFDREIRANVLRNIWLFIPTGTILFSLYPQKRVLLIPAIISILIEIIQYLTGIGYCDAGDVVCNCLGAVTGFMTADGVRDIRIRFLKRKETIRSQRSVNGSVKR